MRSHCNVTVSFPAQKSKIELKIVMKTWDILKAALYLIALLHTSNENTAYLFEVSRYIECFETRTKHLLCSGARLISDFKGVLQWPKSLFGN